MKTLLIWANKKINKASKTKTFKIYKAFVTNWYFIYVFQMNPSITLSILLIAVMISGGTSQKLPADDIRPPIWIDQCVNCTTICSVYLTCLKSQVTYLLENNNPGICRLCCIHPREFGCLTDCQWDICPYRWYWILN